MQTLSDEGLALLAGSEGLRVNAYHDQAGVWTIGYGTTRINGEPVTRGMEINIYVARALLRGDARLAATAVSRFITAPLTQAQFDALVSFTYNVGVTALQSSTLRRVINAGEPVGEDYFTRWCKVTDPETGQKVVSNGLLARRQREYRRFSGETA